MGLNGIYKGLYLFLTKGTWLAETTQKAMQRYIGIQKKKQLVDAESTSSNALGWIVLDLDIWVRFGFNGFKISFVLSICIRFGLN